MFETKKALKSQCGKSVPAYDQDQSIPVEILQLLHLGSASKWEFLANLYITALLNASRWTLESCMTHLQYKWIP
ncbi:protein phosphatase, partial [Lynx pardinus]